MAQLIQVKHLPTCLFSAVILHSRFAFASLRLTKLEQAGELLLRDCEAQFGLLQSHQSRLMPDMGMTFQLGTLWWASFRWGFMSPSRVSWGSPVKLHSHSHHLLWHKQQIRALSRSLGVSLWRWAGIPAPDLARTASAKVLQAKPSNDRQHVLSIKGNIRHNKHTHTEEVTPSSLGLNQLSSAALPGRNPSVALARDDSWFICARNKQGCP